MFGYIRVYKPELRIKEFELYKSVYCSLCKKLGREYGAFSRFTLSYDFTFLACLKMSLQENTCDIEQKRCVFNPLKKCNYCANIDSDLDFTAAGAMILLYYKALDNIKDEKGFKKFKYKLALPLFKKAYKKAIKKYGYLDDIFSAYVENQAKAENEKTKNIDIAAEPTANMLAKLFELCGNSDADKRALSRLGYCVGRYIYILDAAVDFEEDIKRGRYNPFSGSDVKAQAESQLYMCINEAALAFELIDIKKIKNILGNIVCLGLEDTMKKELQI